MKEKNRKSLLFIIIKSMVRVFYPKIEIVGEENLPDEPVVIVGNHTQMNGPIACELYLPDNCYTWCAGQMMNLKEVPAYAFTDFWSQKPKSVRWLFKIASYIIAPLSVIVFNNARTIAVHRDNRVINTFRNSMQKLKDGNSLVIFPEYNKEYNNILYDFQDRFIDLAKIYYNRTGLTLSFVPLYIAPKLKKMYFGTPITFNPEEEIDIERKRIKGYLMKEITDIAVNLPEHIVIPYRNIPKKYYKTNTAEASTNEKTNG